MRKAIIHVGKEVQMDLSEYFQYHWYRPVLTTKDSLDYDGLLREFPSVNPTCKSFLMLVDIYHLYPAELLAVPHQEFVLVNQAYGVDSIAGVNFGSSPFFIDKDGLLHQKPGLISEEWVPHNIDISRYYEAYDSYTDGVDSLMWVIKQSVLDYRVYSGVRVCNKTCEPRRLNCATSEFEMVEFKYKSLFFFENKEKKPVAKLLAERLISEVMFSAKQSFAITGITKKVNDYLNDKRFSPLFEFAPMSRFEIACNTIEFVTFNSVAQEAQMLKKNAQTYGESLAELRHYKNNLTKTTATYSFRTIILVAILCYLAGVFTYPVIYGFVYGFVMFWWYFFDIEVMFYIFGWAAILCLVYYRRYIKFPQSPVSDPFDEFLRMYRELDNDKFEGNTIDCGLRTLPDYVHPTDDKHELEPPQIHVLAATQCIGHQPKGEANFMRAYQLRNKSAVGIPLTNCEITCAKKAEATCRLAQEWNVAYHAIDMLFGDLQMDIVNAESRETRSEWANNFGSAMKKERARSALERIRDGELQINTECFLKGDETLFPKEIDGKVDIKPRVIQAVNPDVQAMCGKDINNLIRHMKRNVFHHKRISFLNNVRFSISIGSGKTSKQLDQWYNECLFDINTVEYTRKTNTGLTVDKDFAVTMHAMVAGDDFIAICGDKKGRIWIVENDFSKFDRTQGRHALDFEYKFCSKIQTGSDEYSPCFKVLCQMSRAVPVFKDRTGHTKKMPAPIQRFSGAPDTTLGNCITNIGSLLYVIQCSGTDLDFDHIQELGFESKLKKHSLESGATFLKGWWIYNQDSDYFNWMPLPSQIIKLGKVGTAPEKIFKDVDPAEAHRRVAAAMAMGYPIVPYNYPIFGCFLKKMRSLTDKFVRPLKVSEYGVGMYGASECVDREIAMQLICERYDLSVEDVLDLEKIIEDAPFPCVMVDQRFNNLVRADYG